MKKVTALQQLRNSTLNVLIYSSVCTLSNRSSQRTYHGSLGSSRLRSTSGYEGFPEFDEIKEAVNSLKVDKAARPNGFIS